MTFIISEIGVNWDGDLNLLQEMMQESKKAGCNVVKFQSFNEKMIVDHPKKSSDNAHH